ncbi:H+ Antiporter protein [Listeria grayi]|uniref:H+ Antiporter protein n=1 Tax=Listeria grayi TaxID=1641 RepID=A0A378MI74_LISGR|nr:MFS transporter [Listeria grayi]STY43475.1 H+ Antiporter protein [Listeria grayi]
MEDHAKQSQQQVFKFLLSMLTGNLGSSILTFIIGLLILKSTDSAIQFGISQVIGPLVALLLLPFTGSMIDKFDKKKVLIAAQFLSIGSLAVYSILIYFQGFDNLIYTYVLLIS